MKTKQMMLFLDFVSKGLVVISLYCFGSLSGAYAFIVSFFAVIFANIKEKTHKKLIGTYIFFELLYIGVLIYTYVGISSILVFIFSSVMLLTIWWLPPQQIRLWGGFNSMVFLAYQIAIKNWAGLLEIIILVSNFAAYIQNRRKA